VLSSLGGTYVRWGYSFPFTPLGIGNPHLFDLSESGSFVHRRYFIQVLLDKVVSDAGLMPSKTVSQILDVELGVWSKTVWGWDNDSQQSLLVVTLRINQSTFRNILITVLNML
jgi:hypothetical protein